MTYSDDIICLKGIGEKTVKLFHKIGVFTIKDLIEYYPRNYQVFDKPILLSEAKDKDLITCMLFVPTDFKWKKFRNMTIGNGIGVDEAGNKIQITYFNVTYLKSRLSAGNKWLFRGSIKIDSKGYHMDQPKIYSYEEYEKLMGSLQPCYMLTDGLTNYLVTKAVKQAIEKYQPKEYLPQTIVDDYKLLSPIDTIQTIHFPINWEAMLEARKRLVFDEFFLFLLSMRKMKQRDETLPADYPMIETAWPERMIEALPYKLTNAQQRVWEEIKRDLTSGFAMNRLVQGDVGSGKTILAFLSLLLCITNGYQGALMAPTEILATQHFEQLQWMCKTYHLPCNPVLLTGSLSTLAKKEIYQHIENGDYNIIIGTHALIQEKVKYKNLALVITDEQHRFGVRQREALSGKSGKAHVLVMSATPIPRTLAIILFGDLHLSTVDELPADRLPIKNCVVGTSYRNKAYEFICDEVRKGHQAYIICPMVEETEGMEDIENVTDYTEKLRSVLPPQIHIEALHGKMKAAEKKRIMDEFHEGNIHVLVSTTVIEVGINVPLATVMLVENAERFGLAQLHQLRGRIGRGHDQSYCIFINGSNKIESKSRLEILNRSNDGFYISEEDLKLRGPGDLFGIRQSGIMEFKIADVYQDSEILKEISSLVDNMLFKDPELLEEENQFLKQYLIENEGNFIDFRSI